METSNTPTEEITVLEEKKGRGTHLFVKGEQRSAEQKAQWDNPRPGTKHWYTNELCALLEREDVTLVQRLKILQMLGRTQDGYKPKKLKRKKAQKEKVLLPEVTASLAERIAEFDKPNGVDRGHKTEGQFEG